MNIIEKEIAKLRDEELEQCFKEITEYKESSFMGYTLVRKIRDNIAHNIINDDKWDQDCRTMIIPEILYEISKRYYLKKELKNRWVWIIDPFRQSYCIKPEGYSFYIIKEGELKIEICDNNYLKDNGFKIENPTSKEESQKFDEILKGYKKSNNIE